MVNVILQSIVKRLLITKVIYVYNETPEGRIDIFLFTKYMPYIMDSNFINMSLKTSGYRTV